jgi:uncharacterized protein
MTSITWYRRPLTSPLNVALVVVLAIVGLFLVKWQPYFHKALVAANTHSIGHSILMGASADPPPASLRSAVDYSMTYLKAIWQAMLLGLLLGTAVQEFIPSQWLARHLGNRNLRSVSTGALFALPGMMCTCCAVPVAIGLRRSAASAAAAAAFWLGNTVLNPATLVFMGLVLGWQWTGLRLALGIPLVWGMGYLINLFDSQAEERQILTQRVALGTVSMSGHGTLAGWFMRFVRVLVRLIPEYLLLVLLLGAARAWLFPHIGVVINNDLYWIILMAAAGFLFVIPTAGEVPIVQAMLSLGMGAGPAAALLMTLPPVSLPSLVMAQQGFSRRALWLISLSVLSIGIAGGVVAKALHW